MSKASKSKKKKSESPVKQAAAAKTLTQDNSGDFLHTIAFWGLAILLFLPPYFRGLFFQPEQERALIFAAVVFWIAWLWKWTKRDYSFLSHPLDYFILAFPVVYIISAFQAVNYGLAVDEVVKTTLYFLVYWLASRLVRNEKDMVTILQVIYVSAIGVALAGLATATGVIHINDGFLNGRIYSTFQYPNALASYLAAVTFIGFCLWRRAGDPEFSGFLNNYSAKDIPEWLNFNRYSQYLYAAGNFILFAVLLGTRSNGGLLVFAVVFVIFIIGLPRGSRIPVFIHFVLTSAFSFAAIWQFLSAVANNKMDQAWLWVLAGLVMAAVTQLLYGFSEKKGLLQWIAKHKTIVLAVVLLFVIAGCIGAGAYINSHSEAVKNLVQEFRLRNAAERMYFFQDAMKMFKERPVTGWGGGGWQEAYRAYQGYLYNSNQVHGHYFQIMVETGILGLLVILGIWISFLCAAHRIYYGAKENPAARLLAWTVIIAAVCIGAHAAIDFDLSLSALALVLWTMFGFTRGMLIYSSIRVEDKKKKKFVPPNYFILGTISAAAILIIILTGSLAAAGNYAVQAGKHINSQNPAQAVGLLQKAVAYNPLKADYHGYLARIYQAQGKYDEAITEAQKAAELSKYSSLHYSDLASIYFNGKKGNHEAVNNAEKALSLAPFQIQWYETLSRTFFVVGYNELVTGNREKAKQFFEEATGIPGRIDDKMATLNETEKRLWLFAPKMTVTPTVKLNVGASQYLLGRWTEAEANLKVVLKDEKNKGEASLWLAVLRDKQGRAKEAQELLAQAQKLVPEMAKGYEGIKNLLILK